MNLPFIVVVCEDEKYVFHYEYGNEDELVCRMIEYALDDRHALGWGEVRAVMEHLGQTQKMRKAG